MQALKPKMSGLTETYRILIVDDDPDIRDSLKDAIELEEGLEAAPAGDIQRALDVARDFLPDIALLDIKLGSQNGLELILPLKEIRPDMICIIMTAHRDAEYAVTAVKRGADDYLYKPLDFELLLKTLRRNLISQGLQRQKTEMDRRFQAIFEQTFQILILMNRRGEVINANRTAWELFNGGRPPEDEQASQDFYESTLGPLLREKLSETIEQSISNNALLRGETEFVSHNGENRIFDFSLKPVESENEEEFLLIFEGRDITERKRSENEIKQLNENLEARVRERTRELEEARDEAERANKAKSQFLARMSHELRTPLNAVMGFSQLLVHDPENRLRDFERDSLAAINQAGENLLELVNQVLSLSAIEKGAFELNREEFPLKDVVLSCINMAASLAATKNVRLLEPEFPAADVRITADPLRFQQVLSNLLNNAIKYNKEGGEVEVRVLPREGGSIRIHVRDTGPGMEPEALARAFLPFERLSADYQVGGSGVGLAICNYLMQAMGGELGATSKPGEGSDFWLEFKAG